MLLTLKNRFDELIEVKLEMLDEGRSLRLYYNGVLQNLFFVKTNVQQQKFKQYLSSSFTLVEVEQILNLLNK